jgi:hypothetical protein
MSRQATIHNGSVLGGRGHSAALWSTPSLVIGLTAVVLVALALLAVMWTNMSGDLRGLRNLEGLAAASEYASLHGVAAVRAAADAAVSAAR